MKTPLWAKTTFAVDPKPISEHLTAHGGMALLARSFRSLKLPGSCLANFDGFKTRARGFEIWQMIESTLVGLLLGADNVEDLDRLREDPSGERLLGYTPPSARTVREMLERFHDEAAVTKAEAQAQAEGRLAFIPEPTLWLDRLATVLGVSARATASVGSRVRTATVDLDATIVESWKQAAKWTYEGVKGYQPVVAVWAEADAVLATEFRDGNVPAQMEPLRCAKAAFAALPGSMDGYGFRGDSACHENDLLGWLRNEDRLEGPKGRIRFAVSARMSPELHAACAVLPETAWRVFPGPKGKDDAAGRIREWAEVDFVPSEATERKDLTPLRYLGIRIRARQGELFEDGSTCRHFAVITNATETGSEVIEWHRQKAGTVEHVHDEVKNALAGGSPPSQHFGANAAWFMLNAMAYNLASAIRAAAPDPTLRTARIKQIRYRLFHVAARSARDRRKISVRFAASREWVRNFIAFFEVFKLRTIPTG